MSSRTNSSFQAVIADNSTGTHELDSSAFLLFVCLTFFFFLVILGVLGDVSFATSASPVHPREDPFPSPIASPNAGSEPRSEVQSSRRHKQAQETWDPPVRREFARFDSQPHGRSLFGSAPSEPPCPKRHGEVPAPRTRVDQAASHPSRQAGVQRRGNACSRGQR